MLQFLFCLGTSIYVTSGSTINLRPFTKETYTMTLSKYSIGTLKPRIDGYNKYKLYFGMCQDTNKCSITFNDKDNQKLTKNYYVGYNSIFYSEPEIEIHNNCANRTNVTFTIAAANVTSSLFFNSYFTTTNNDCFRTSIYPSTNECDDKLSSEYIYFNLNNDTSNSTFVEVLGRGTTTISDTLILYDNNGTGTKISKIGKYYGNFKY